MVKVMLELKDRMKTLPFTIRTKPVFAGKTPVKKAGVMKIFEHQQDC
ncbi:hypothetical protein AF72_08385 [Xylella taiwanensis]|uniref:Uncharacterized protein n=1 Tax=Xylella taiwanensis TaxID=1444770 RepID=Z9JJ20_9GAMM|nr:hypothetical protein AF72_08385 [Xylella taiwanensis]